jgi:hypothetical protein
LHELDVHRGRGRHTHRLVVPSDFVLLDLAEHTMAMRFVFSPALVALDAHAHDRSHADSLNDVAYVGRELANAGAAKLLDDPIATIRQILFLGVGY